MATTRYPRALILLHWILALLIIVALAAGKIMLDDVPNSDPGKAFSLTAHMTVGLVILVLTLGRIVVRLRGPNPPADNLAASAGHGLLYLLTLVMLASGITMAMGANLGGILFFGAEGTLPERFEGLPRTVHGTAASLLILLVIVHIAAAVWHRIKGDGVMARMSLRG